MKQIIINGGATGGLTSATLREGLGRSLGEICTLNTGAQKQLVLGCKENELCAEPACLGSCWLLPTCDSPTGTEQSEHLN